MRVTIKFPLVMKMECSILVDDAEKLSLEDVQKRAFEGFWQMFSSHFEKHGSIANAILYHKGAQIKTDEMWKTCLKTDERSFQVIFRARH